MLLYSLGLLIGWLAVGGNFGYVLLESIGISLFWLIWLVSRGKGGAERLYVVGFGLTLILGLFGLLALPTLDDTNLRTNALSGGVLEEIQKFLPSIPTMTMHRNSLAGMLAVFGTLALAYSLFGLRLWERLVSGIATLLYIAMLLITNSRGGLVAFVAGVVLVGALGWNRYGPKTRRWLARGGLGLVGLILAYLLLSGQYRLFSPERLLSENGTSRLEIWSNTLYILGEVPLTGLGPGRFEGAYPFYIDPAAPLYHSSQEHPHNLFLQSYIAEGLPGLLAMLWATGLWAVLFWKVVRGIEKAEFRRQNSEYGMQNAEGRRQNVGETGQAEHSSVLRPSRAEARSYNQPSAFRSSRAEARSYNSALILHPSSLIPSPLLGGLASFGALLVYGLAEHSTWNSQFIEFMWIPLALVGAAWGMQNVEGRRQKAGEIDDAEHPSVLSPSRAEARSYNSSLIPHPSSLILYLSGLVLAVVIGWQGWGLAQVNAASLEKLQNWHGDRASLEHIRQLYHNAEGISGWTGVPQRGLAWISTQLDPPQVAEKAVREVLARDPHDTRFSILLGEMLTRQGRKEEALQVWRKADVNLIFVERGRRLLDADYDPRAEAELLTAIELDPRWWESYEMLIMYYGHYNRIPPAIALVEKALTYLPGEPEAIETLQELKARR